MHAEVEQTNKQNPRVQSIQDGIYALWRAHNYLLEPVSQTFPNVAFEIVPVFKRTDYVRRAIRNKSSSVQKNWLRQESHTEKQFQCSKELTTSRVPYGTTAPVLKRTDYVRSAIRNNSSSVQKNWLHQECHMEHIFVVLSVVLLFSWQTRNHDLDFRIYN